MKYIIEQILLVLWGILIMTSLTYLVFHPHIFEYVFYGMWALFPFIYYFYGRKRSKWL